MQRLSASRRIFVSRASFRAPGHQAGILDVKIFAALDQVLSYSKQATLKVWDIKDQVCVQSVQIKFPSVLDGRQPEHGPFPVELFLKPSPFLIITARYVHCLVALRCMVAPRGMVALHGCVALRYVVSLLNAVALVK